MVEHGTHKPKAVGSIPTSVISKICNRASKPKVGGSNPPADTVKEIASLKGSPRFAWRLIRIQFWG